MYTFQETGKLLMFMSHIGFLLSFTQKSYLSQFELDGIEYAMTGMKGCW